MNVSGRNLMMTNSDKEWRDLAQPLCPACGQGTLFLTFEVYDDTYWLTDTWMIRIPQPVMITIEDQSCHCVLSSSQVTSVCLAAQGRWQALMKEMEQRGTFPARQ